MRVQHAGRLAISQNAMLVANATVTNIVAAAKYTEAAILAIPAIAASVTMFMHGNCA